MRKILLIVVSLFVVFQSCAQDDFFSILASQTPLSDLTPALRQQRRPAFDGVTPANDWDGRTSMVDLGDRQILIFRESTGHSVEAGSWNIRYSEDGFRTYTANNTLLGGGSSTFFPYSGGTASGATAAADAILVKCPNGDILLITAQTKVGTPPDDWVTIWQHRSTDGGETWTSDGDLGTMIPSISDTRKIWAFYDYEVVGNDIYLPFAEYSSSKNISRVRLAKSSDNGATYTSHATIFPYGSYPSNPNETGLIHISGGHMIAISRTWGLYYTLQSESFDYGATWSAYTDISSKFGGFGVHQPRLRKFASDNPNRIWLVARWYDNADDTKNIVCWSDNAASTWTIFPIDENWPGDSGYVDMIKRDDGEYYITAYFGNYDDATITDYVLEMYDSTVYSDEYNVILHEANSKPVPIPSHDWRVKQNQLYASLDAAGIFSKTDVFAVGMQDGSSIFGLINWVDVDMTIPTQPTGTNWWTGEGWRNVGSAAYATLGWSPSDGVNYQQNSCAWAVGIDGHTPPAAVFSSESGTTNTNRVWMQSGSTTTAHYMLNSAGGTVTLQLHNTGRYYAERTASNATEIFFNNSSLRTETRTSATRSTALITIAAARNSSGVYSSPMNTGAVKYLWFGAPLTSTERGNFDSIMNTYITP